MCVTHGMPCVTMHGLYEGYVYGSQIQFGERGSSFSPWEQQGGGRREKEKEERRREGEEMEGGREERRGERKEEKRRGKGRKRGKRKRMRKECCIVGRPKWQRTRNLTTRGRFPPTLVILCLGAV